MTRIEVSLPTGISGDYIVTEYTNETESKYWQQYLNMKNESHDRYTVLIKDDCPMPIMQDSEAEYNEHQWLWDNATGDVLVGGLGIGMIHQPLIDNPNVTSVTIVELEQDVVDLVWEHCAKDDRFTLIQEDLETWDIPTDSSWNIAWLDTWLTDNSLTMNEYDASMNDKYSPYCEEIKTWC